MLLHIASTAPSTVHRASLVCWLKSAQSTTKISAVMLTQASHPFLHSVSVSGTQSSAWTPLAHGATCSARPSLPPPISSSSSVSVVCLMLLRHLPRTTTRPLQLARQLVPKAVRIKRWALGLLVETHSQLLVTGTHQSRSQMSSLPKSLLILRKSTSEVVALLVTRSVRYVLDPKQKKDLFLA